MRIPALRRGVSGVLMANVGARVAALVSLAVATLVICLLYTSPSPRDRS